jgi:hypothetical protein
VKRLKLWIALGGGALVMLVVAAAAQEKKQSAAPPAAKPTFEVDIPTAQEVRAMLGAYGQRVEDNEKGLADLRSEFAKTREAIEQSLIALAEAQKRDLMGLDSLLRSPAPQEAMIAPARFRSIELSDAKPASRAVHIPAGSFGEATLMTGAFAPTSGEALPVLLRLDAALIGPRRSRIPIRGAFIVGKAIGDANSERATIQLDTLSVVCSDGKTIEVKTNGWAIDDDGVQGVRGTYVWRASEIAALAAATRGLSAASEALATRETTVAGTPLGGTVGAVTGDPLKFAGYRALGGAADKIAETVARRLDEITPAVHVSNGRRVTIAFVNGVTLEGLDAEAADKETPYAGLDAENK